MKAVIKIKRLNRELPLPKAVENGDWIDLRCSRKTEVGVTPITIIPLGIAARLPRGYEAIVAPRSSTPKNFGICCSNSIGVIDNSYNGNEDEWQFSATTIGCSKTIINTGDRICQFRIQLSQHATMWQRIKWLFTSGVEIVEVGELQATNRGGFGTSGKK